MNEWTDGEINEWTDGEMNRWKDDRMNMRSRVSSILRDRLGRTKSEKAKPRPMKSTVAGGTIENEDEKKNRE